MVTIFSGLSRVIIDLGFRAAIIQAKEIDQVQLSSIFWINTVVGVALMSTIYLVSPYVASFYEEPRVEPLMKLISPVYLFACLNVVQSGLFSRSKAFKILAFRSMWSDGIGGIVGVTLAIYGFGVDSLAWQILVGAIMGMLLVWTVSDWRPSFVFNWASIRGIVQFGANMFGSSVLNYSVKNLDSLMIGKFYSSAALGLYNKSFNFISIPQRNISTVVNRALLPHMASVGHLESGAKKSENLHLKSWTLIAFVVIPMMLIVSFNAEDFILGVFGIEWLSAVPLVSVFSVIGIFASLDSSAQTFIVSKGNSKLIFRIGLLAKGLAAIGICLGILYGPLYVALAICTVSLISCFLFIWGVTKVSSLTIYNQALVVLKYLTVGCLCSIAGHAFIKATPLGASIPAGLISFATITLVTGLIYIVVLLALKDEITIWSVGQAQKILSTLLKN